MLRQHSGYPSLTCGTHGSERIWSANLHPPPRFLKARGGERSGSGDKQRDGRRWRRRRVGAFEPLEGAAPASAGRQRPPQALHLLPTRHGGRRRQARESHRRLQEHSDKIQINTDARSNKIGEIRNCPFGEICWYFADSWEQFRISGSIDAIDGSSADPAKLQNREKAWFASSVRSRLQYLGPQPGVPIIDDEQVKDVHLDPSAVPVEAFCLLVLDPEMVDYLNLKSNQRLIFTRSHKDDGSVDWMAEKVSP
ncbi:hypothetical protein PAHAL_9G632300 [Panicum hallii]|uniref:pyridoxal 5'-phosphate synthase n=1 Tax=Panicum hallii TaxID=206008 RepID=A0A2T8I6Q0_9POAL|nr:hypothetical protein PAHAL_9G632300 [Panicum hallii]PVH33343.1 hypothetical protein PAHAL_9G632300 [Panicum hallii]